MKKTEKKNIISWIGVCCIIAAYALMSFSVYESESIQYNFLNLIGGCLLGLRFYLDKNWANFTLECIFILIAIKSII